MRGGDQFASFGACSEKQQTRDRPSRSDEKHRREWKQPPGSELRRLEFFDDIGKNEARNEYIDRRVGNQLDAIGGDYASPDEPSGKENDDSDLGDGLENCGEIREERFHGLR